MQRNAYAASYQLAFLTLNQCQEKVNAHHQFLPDSPEGKVLDFWLALYRYSSTLVACRLTNVNYAVSITIGTPWAREHFDHDGHVWTPTALGVAGRG
jgi:hypothetical protein